MLRHGPLSWVKNSQALVWPRELGLSSPTRVKSCLFRAKAADDFYKLLSLAVVLSFVGWVV